MVDIFTTQKAGCVCSSDTIHPWDESDWFRGTRQTLT